MLEAYHHGDWDRWVACYHPTAQVFYNTASESLTPQGAAEMHAASVALLSDYSFEESDDHFRAWVDDEVVLEATYLAGPFRARHRRLALASRAWSRPPA